MENQPFIYKFKTGINNYIYDVNTNNIVQVDDIVYELLEDIDKLSAAEMVEKHRKKYNVNIIQEQIDSIKQFMSNGLFSSYRPEVTGYPKDLPTIKSELNSQRCLLTLEISQQCNMRCRYCIYSDKYYYTRKHSPKYMNFDIARKAIDQFLGQSLEAEHSAIGFYGGEPLLNFELIKACVEYVNRVAGGRGLSYNITTNGTLLNGSRVEFLIENNFSITVSLDGPKEIHDRNRIYKNGRGSYNTVIANLRQIKEQYPDFYRGKIRFNSIISPPVDYMKLNKFAASFDLFKDNSVRYNAVDAFGTSYYDDFEESELRDRDGAEKLMQRYVSSCIDKDSVQADGYSHASKMLLNFVANEVKLMLIYKRPVFGMPKKDFYPGLCCIPGVNRSFTSAEGEYFPCERVNTNDKRLCIGNVESGIQLSRAMKIIEQVADLFRQNCHDCWACRLCDLCYVSIGQGSDNRKDFHWDYMQEVCEWTRKSASKALRLFCNIMERNPGAFDDWEKIKL